MFHKKSIKKEKERIVQHKNKKGLKVKIANTVLVL